MKRTVTIKIEVDQTGSKEQQNTFFKREVDSVLEKFSVISKRDKSKLSSEEGHTEDGSKFKIVVKKVK